MPAISVRFTSRYGFVTVLIPGITDKDEYLEELRDFLSTLSNIQRIDVLPYHTMGIYKYEKLGIPYPLDGIEPPGRERVAHAESDIAEGIIDPAERISYDMQ